MAAEYKDSALIDWNSCTSPTCTVTDAYNTENILLGRFQKW